MKEANDLSDKTATLLQLKEQVQKFVDDRDWRKFHSPKNLAMSIAIEASELMEVFQWVGDKELDTLLQDAGNLASLEEELADITIYCLSLANATNVDVAKAVVKKIEKNKRKYPAGQYYGKYKRLA